MSKLDAEVIFEKELKNNFKLVVEYNHKLNIKSVKYYKNGKLHSKDDRPALTTSEKTRIWYKNGVIHRDNDKPAIIYGNNDKLWHKYGKLHRDNNKPAVIYYDGYCYWFKNGIEYVPEKVFVFLNSKEKRKIAKYCIRGEDAVSYLVNKYINEKKKMNSKRKGNNTERQICKLFEKRFNNRFYRVPTSGAVATVQNLYENANKVLAGDIITPENFKFSIEVKSRKEFNLWELLGEKEVPEWIAWWQQASLEAEKARREPLVVIKYNNRKIICFIDKKYINELNKNNIRFIEYNQFLILLLDNLFKLKDNFFYIKRQHG